MLNLEKLSYSIGQVSALTEIAQSTLRYWETVVLSLNPFKTEGGSRRYSKADIELIVKIKDLLYNQGFTIKGANLYLNNLDIQSNEEKPDNTVIMENSIKVKGGLDRGEILNELLNIKKILDR